MLSHRVVAVILLALCHDSVANSLDFNMSNNTAQVKIGTPASATAEGNAELVTGILFDDKENIFTEAGLRVRNGGMAQGNGGTEEGNGGSEEGDGGNPEAAQYSGTPGVSTGGGIKAVLATVQGTKTSFVSCIAMGAEVAFTLPTVIPIVFSAEYYSTFKIITFLDAERYNHLELHLEATISPDAKIYWGYREIGFGIKKIGGATLDRSNFVGVVIPY